MTRPAVPPLWRAAPARLVRMPGWLLLLLAAATLFVASVVAPPLFVTTARATALADGLTAAEGTPYGDESGDLRVTWDAPLKDDPEQVVLDRLAALPGYGPPTVTAASTAQSLSRQAVAVADGRRSTAVLWYRDGAVAALGGGEGEGVWLAADTARDLEVEVGDVVGLGIAEDFLGAGQRVVPVPLAGTFEPGPGTSLPAVLADQPDADRWFVPADPTRPTVDPPLAVVDRATFDRVSRRTDGKPLYVADLPLDPGVTPEQAHAAADATDRLADDAYDPVSDLYSALGSPRDGAASLSVITGLPGIVQAAEVTATTAREQVRPYAVGGVVLAAVLLVAAWVLLGLSRRREQLLASGLGLRPVELAGLAGLEALLPCAVAVPLGVALAHLGVVLAGPDTAFRAPVTSEEVVRAGTAAAVALVLLVVAAGTGAVVTDRMSRVSRLGSARRAYPWAVALLVMTAVVTVAVVSVDVADRSSTLLTTVFPLLVASTVAVLVVRGVARLRSWVPTRARPGSPRWLAARRGGAVVREVAALAVVVAVGLGLFVYTLTVQRGIEAGVEDKTAAIAGAASAIQVAEDLRGRGTTRAVSPPVPGTTVVWTRGVTLPPTYGTVPLLAVDSSTFGDVAEWGGSGDLDAGRDLLPALAAPGKQLPVVLVGDTDLRVGDQAVVELMEAEVVPAVVVGVVPAFPGADRTTGSTAVVADSRRLFRMLGDEPPVIDPRRPGAASDDAGAFTSTVWGTGSVGDLRSGLRRVGITNDGAVTTAGQARIDAGLVASTWAAGYVLALGVVTLALAVAAGLVLVLRLALRDTVSDVLLQRMGYAPRDLARARAWEVAYAVATGVLAAGLAAAVLVLGPSTVDAAAGIPPLTRPRADLADLVVLLAVLVGTVVVAWVGGTLLARRRSAAEVLRAGE